MASPEPQFVLKLAQSTEEIEAAQRLRYKVFIQELAGDGDMVDHDAQLEKDRFDPVFDHLILFDTSRSGQLNDQAIGVYRLLRDDKAGEIGQFYSEDEYDLSVLKQSGRKLLELGRSCLHPDYRGGAAMYHLWNGLAEYVFEHEIEILFGVASFHGTDVASLAAPLSLLHHRHLAPQDLRVRTQLAHFQTMDLIPEAQINRLAAMRDVPALIKAYLRLGGFVGEGAYVDYDFNTVDVSLVMDTQRMNAKQKAIYTRGPTT